MCFIVEGSKYEYHYQHFCVLYLFILLWFYRLVDNLHNTILIDFNILMYIDNDDKCMFACSQSCVSLIHQRI